MVSCRNPMDLVDSIGYGSLDSTPMDLVELIC
jgi:hypothetical protein